MLNMILAALLIAAPTKEIPVEERYGGVIAVMGDIPQDQIDTMMDEVCGVNKWKLWKITVPDKSKLPPQLQNAKAREHRFYCVPHRRFVPDKK